jgi:DNA modification methylase
MNIEKKKKPRKPKALENQPGRYDDRNNLNDLTGKEWLLLTKSFWETEPSNLDKTAYAHPAPFMVKDIQKLVSMFTKKGMTVLDPFVGSGTALIACNAIERNGIGIDLNLEYYNLYKNRIKESKIEIVSNLQYIIGDSLTVIDSIGEIDYIVTSPPYFNILKNDSKGTRNNSGKLYRMAAREGVESYSDAKEDIGNYDEYADFLSALEKIFTKAYLHLRSKKYATIIMSDFTVNRKEQPVQCDIINMMMRIGFEFCGTTVLFQPVKPLYPFGYPYAYKINHHHQNLMTFRKMNI